MSRTGYFVAALVLGVIAVFWWMAKWLLYFGYAEGHASVEGPIPLDDSFIATLVVWGIVFIGIIWGAWVCLKRAFSRPPRLDSRPLAPSPPIMPEKQQDLRTPDERLADLVKKRET